MLHDSPEARRLLGLLPSKPVRPFPGAWVASALLLAALEAFPGPLGVRSCRADLNPPSFPGKSHPPTRDPYLDFTQTCVEAFVQSNGPLAKTPGERICGCAAEESKHQGVTVQALQEAGARIRKDPGYKIESPRLLAAFQYCTMLSMEEADRANKAPEKNAKPGPG